MLSRFRLGFQALGVVVILIFAKITLFLNGWELLTLNALITSAIAGAIFIVGFLLSGIIADYKEAEKMPGEIRGALENIFEDARMFAREHPAFALEDMRKGIGVVVTRFFEGVSVNAGARGLVPCLSAIDALSAPLAQMEALGAPANYIVRLRAEQGMVRRAVLRISHVQRTQFIPSAHILAESLICFVIALLFFLKTEGSPESFVVFAFISYLFTYVGLLIRVVEQPFRQGAGTQDDVSLFLLHEFEEKLQAP